MRLPAWAFPDEEHILTSYPVSRPLGNVGGARKLHIYGDLGRSYHRAVCGVVLEHYVEYSSTRRPVCASCRRLLEGGKDAL